MHKNIKLECGALQELRDNFILTDVSRKSVFFFLSADVCYHDLKMIYGKSSSEDSWSGTNLKRPRRPGHYLHAAFSALGFPDTFKPQFSFQKDQSELSFLFVNPEKTLAVKLKLISRPWLNDVFVF